MGSAENLDNRLKEHQRGLSAYTKTRLPIELVYSEEYPTKEEAAKREYQIKRWSHAKKEALINGDFERLKQLCKSKTLEFITPLYSYSSQINSNPTLSIKKITINN